MAGSHWIAMPPRFSLKYFDPPPELARHVLALFHFVWDEDKIQDRHPGALGQIALFMRGQAEADFGDAKQEVKSEVVLFGGFTRALPYRVKGPWHAAGLSLSPLGWAALTGQPLNTHLDRFYPAEQLIDPAITEFAAQTNAAYRAGDVSGEEACSLLAEWVTPRLRAIPPPHEAVIETTIDWLGSSLNPDIEMLFSKLGYSRRQAERLIERYFGFSPAALARKFRAVRASALLAQDNLSDEAEAEIAEAFHDQPHMIREISRFCGSTPSRLGGTDEPLFHTMLRLKNLDRLGEFRALE
ncbi:hypothetical protein BPTFM16_02233 [Altererythrobacter insulae]|nr:hypothetical protein BPTFM16_02233 [Altererythrobacter insulae]